MYIIEFENIDLGYDENLVLKDINLKIKQGEHWAILGANGSGKSTLLKLIQSQIHPRANKKFKKEIFGKSRYSIFELKKELGIITNDLHSYFAKEAYYLSAYEVVLSGYYGWVGMFDYKEFSDIQKQKAYDVMEFVEILDIKNKKVSAMSTGELRRALIARALIDSPKVFILDEPTVGLDIKSQINFIKMLKKLAQNSSIILVTHHLEEIFEEIDNIALIHNQTIYKQGKKEDILTSKNLSEIFNLDLKIDKKNGRYYIKSIG
ncbi:MAG: ATP-binding cassette domain-containing protein [Arcobacter butzleri]|jgi:iron complex transport system ATP-binding protein|nr:ATP-binding cassette domain-containing protein [Arcobacteraceae bacterium]MDY0365250.1 ATP-binding cassette domain-containing protein [Arcobacteraceae bacterium]NLO18152.1 ATP-binding cassette domain-containing protein [Aliarcobacter butzleri]